MDALDLRKHPPRSPRETLPGLDLLIIARTVDKIRATLPGGNLGPYKIPGFSSRTLAGLGIEESELRDEVARAVSDADVAQWIAARVDADRIAQVNAALSKPTLADRIVDAEWLANNPFAKTLPPETKLLDYLIADDQQLYAGNPN